MQAKAYNLEVDVLRIISILAVILIHTTTKTLEIAHYDLVAIPGTLFLNQISRFAVPLFFIISGFVLELNYPTDHYFRKRISKIAIPYLAWSLVYYFLVYTLHSENFFHALISGSSSYQLYFIPSLLIFYLLFPIFHALRGVLFNRYVLSVLGILEILILRQDYYVSHLPYFFVISVAIFNTWGFIFGMFLASREKVLGKVLKKFRWVMLLLTLALGSFVFIEGLYWYYQKWDIGYFYSQWRPSVFLYTLALGGFGYYFFSRLRPPPGIIMTLSRLSFFVFFVHIIVLELVWRNLAISFPHTFGFDLLFFALVAFLSFSLAYLAHRITHLSKITG